MNLQDQFQRQLATRDWYRPRAATAADLGSFKPDQQCHTNVARWLTLHPHHFLVRGWQVQLNAFVARLIIDTGTEKIDITLDVARYQLRFLPFHGPDEAFWRLPQEVPRFAPAP